MNDLEWLAIILTSTFAGNRSRRFCIFRAHQAPPGLECRFCVGWL